MSPDSHHPAAAFPPPPADHLARPRYRADVDGLRAIAVGSVVAFHAFPDRLEGGFIGVDIFFVISGYLISSIIFRSLEERRFSFAEFYARRIRRIFPALVLVLASCLAAGWVILVARDFTELGLHVAGGAGFVSNLVLWSEAGYFANASETKPLLHLWSLGIEEQFYLVWPLLVLLAWKWRLNFLAVTVAIIAASFALDVVTVRTDAVASFYSPLARFWELMIGGTLAYMGVHHRAFLTRFSEVKSIAGIALIGAALCLINPERSFPGWWALLPTLGAFLLIDAGPETWVNRNVLANPGVVWVGLISYPLYLWHWPLLTFARITQFGMPSRGIRVAAVAASVVLAWLTYRLVERPLRSTGHDRLKVMALGLAMLAVLVGGYVVYAEAGLPGRAANNNERALFVDYYEELHRSGLKRPYHTECSFYDGKTARKRDAISPECVRPGTKGTWFLWGDSHAQALSPGIRSLLPAGVALAQVATAGCRPKLQPTDSRTPGNACNDSNAFALAQIERLKPGIVIMAQLNKRLATDWDEIADHLHRLGAGKVVLVGPVPQWHPSLPLVIARDYWGQDYERVKIGLAEEILADDARLVEKYGASARLTYVSLVDHLCDARGCLAKVPRVEKHNLMAADYGHLTPSGSVYIVQELLRDVLR